MLFCLFFPSKCFRIVLKLTFCSHLPSYWLHILPSCVYKVSLQVTGYWTNYVLQVACVAVNKPGFQLFHPSASLSVCRAGVGVVLLWMYIFICVNASFICLQHFCFYSYHQCFHPHLLLPSPLLQSTDSPFPSPAAVSLSQNHFWLLLFFKNGFSFLLLSFFFILIPIIIIVKCIWRKSLCIIL